MKLDLALTDAVGIPSIETVDRGLVALQQDAVSDLENHSFWARKLVDAPLLWWSGAKRGERVSIGCPLPGEAAEKIVALSESLGVAEKSVWCAAYLALIALVDGDDDVVGSVVTHARTRPSNGDDGAELYINALPVRVRVGNVRWEDLIRSVEAELREQYSLRYFPLSSIRSELGLDLSASLFSYVDFELPGGDGEAKVRRGTGFVETDYLLTMTVTKSDAGHGIEIVADSAVFDEGFRSRITEYALNIVTEMTRDPGSPIDRNGLLARGELNRLLTDWNDTARSFPDDRCVHELFEAQVRKSPDVIALVHEQAHLSYRELNRRANQLAHYLRGRGVGPESRVGVCLERSPELMIGIVAIVKAGGCYVPLDPDTPDERLRYLVADAGLALLLTAPRVVAKLDGQVDSVVGLGGGPCDWPFADWPETDLPKAEVGLSPGNLAYVIYTSGSTGQPKGVMVQHQSLTNLCYDSVRARGFDESSRNLQFAPIVFDAATAELFNALISGSVLHIPVGETLSSPALFSRYVRDHRINRGYIPPAFLSVLNKDDFASYQSISAGGEALPKQIVEDWSSICSITNAYGPTECTIAATAAACLGDGRVTIGTPLANVTGYVARGDCDLVPIGVAGELCIGGVGLARGYLAQPALTAERFVPNPFGKTPGERLYRTGDLARYLPEGSLEFLGRIDDQVKIRGFRIELGEISAVLARHPQVKDAVVMAREDSPGNKQLVAYVLAPEGPDARGELTGALRRYCQKLLPEYMIPAAFLVLDSFPLTANGKVDRKALPAPDWSSQQSAYVAPEGVAEELLASLWCAVLNVERVGRCDSFFELGGQSLLATRLVSRIREAFAVELPIRTLFELHTLRDQAQAITRAQQRISEVAGGIGPVSREAPIPLSFAQQRLWFLSRLMGPNVVYNIPYALRIHGRVDLAALRRSLETIVARHESLRTRFEAHDGSPIQVVDPPWPLELEVETVASAADLEPFFQAERNYLFDLSRDHLCRFRLLQVGPEGGYVLLVIMHHIVSDGWSSGVFFRELVALYGAFSSDQPSPLEPLPIQYADFAHWQRQWLTGDVLERQLDYWREQLADLPPVLNLPTDRPRPPEQTFRGATQSLALSKELTDRLQQLSRDSGVTLFMTLLSALSVLLSRYSGQTDLAVGMSIANRVRRETEDLIGFFVNTLVLRSDLSGAPRFVDLLQQTRDVALGAYAHQDIPFEHLVEALNPERSLSHSPLFQVMLVMQNPVVEYAVSNHVTMSRIPYEGESESGVSRFELTLSLSETPRGLVGGVEYNTDLFDRSTIVRLLNHYERLLAAIVAAPEERVTRYRFLSDEETRQQLVEWNDTALAFPRGQSMHGLIEVRAADTPDAIALAYRDGQMSYAALNRRANRLAHCLRDRGVGPETRVGICLPRSPEMVVAILGILKAGGCYVPLDPKYPQARLEYLVEDSGVRLVVTSSDSGLDLAGIGRSLLCLDGDWETPELPTGNPASGVSPGNAAYLIYTSGSTGRPKGVVIEHSSAVSLLIWAAGELPPADRRGVLASTSICFDLSIYELFLPLSCGDTCIIVDDILSLEAAPQRERVTLVNTVPSAAKALLDRGLLPPRLAVVNLAGEPLKAELVDRLYADARVGRVYDLYGPSEGTTYSTWTLREPGGVETIGRPVGNTRAYVLDPHGQVMGLRAVGELYLGGAGLARGYLGRAGLTAERFVPNPFGGTPGERVYRTGDLVRYRADGRLEFLGRLDHQVKVRGYRIELGEIETVLAQHDGVDEVVVVAREDAPGDKQLVAYVASAGGRAAADLGGELRAHVQRQLPGYMVPAAVVVLEALPLTPNGKVDRKALPAPDWSHRRAAYEAPDGLAEEQLATLWSAILEVERVGRDDNFFELGGHSLLATRLGSRIRRAFGVELPIRVLFEQQTIRAQAEAIAQAEQRDAGVGLALEPVSRERPLKLSFAQQRLWFLSRMMGPSPVYNIPLALRLSGSVDVSALRRALGVIVSRHESLRTRFEDHDGSPVQVIEPPDELELAEEVVESESDLLARCRAERNHLFDLARDRLCRMGLIRNRGDEGVVLTVTLHHSIADGWSLGVFFRELVALYGAFTAGEPSPLAPLPIQYADYARWQRAWLSGAVLERQLGYWREQLAGLPPLLELPTDRPRPAAQTYAGASERLALSSELSERLKALSREQGVTLFMTLEAAFAVLLSRYSGQSDLAIGTPIANRVREETEGLIGFFVNTLVLRHDLSGNPGFVELLQQTRETALQAYAHQDVPFEHLVEALSPERSLSHSPLFQVMFALQNAPMGVGSLGDVKVSLVRSDGADEGGVSRFDLTLNVMETARGIVGEMEYNTDLFDRATIERLLGHYERLLEAVVGSPEERVSRYELLSEEERRRQLVEWNAAAPVTPRERLIHERFEAEAALRPEATAVLGEGWQVSYGELNRRANRLAHGLRGRGVGAEVRVGICVRRSPERLEAMLGVLKAGGCCVPLDPSYPAARLRHLVEDSGVGLVVSESGLAGLLAGLPVAGWWLDRDWEGAGYATSDPEGVAGPENLAYVSYTVDGRGRPRGVGLAHEGLVSLLAWTRERDESARGGARTLVSLDRSIRELFLALSGEGVVEDARSPRGARREREAGWPVASTQAYVLDREGQLQPLGVAGELYLGGVGLGRGYLERPGLTAERFVPHPFGGMGGERVYRTRDRVRYLADGRLEYVGRIGARCVRARARSRQDELERLLRGHRWVADAVVVAREDAPGQRRLVAYVVGSDAAAGVAAEGLVEGLGEHLRTGPEVCLLPTDWMVLEALPRTASGRVDRPSLPAPGTGAGGYEAPAGVTEELLAGLWGAVLSVERVGRRDNFFELGGHSLLATRLVSRIREAFGVELPIRALFEQQTVAAQARAIEGAQRTADEELPLEPVSREEPLALSFAQQRLWFLSRMMGPSAVYNIPLALRLSGSVDVSALRRSLQTIVERHESLRTRFAEHEGEAVQVIDPPWAVELAVEAQLGEAEIRAVCEAERGYLFDLSEDRLCRIRLLENGEDGSYVLLVNMHHSVSDGWSLGVFFRELVALYGAFTAGEPSPLAPLSIQYADYARWQRTWLSGAVLERQLGYWREQLAGLAPLLELPTDRPRPAAQTYAGASERLALSSELSERLKALSREQGVTLFMTLEAAFAVLLSRYSGQSDLAIGMPVANRVRRETEDLIGFFVNTLVLRHDLSGNPGFVELLKQTRETALQAYAHQDVPFEHLVEALNPERSLSHSPLFQVSFSVLSDPVRPATLGDAELTPLRFDDGQGHGVSRYDIAFSVVESGAGVIGIMEYNTDLFDRSTIERMLDHYRRLLEAILDEPEERVARYELLSAAERRQQLVEWNRTRRYPSDHCLHELFEAQVARAPDATALTFENAHLSYRELNRRANRVAHYLRAQGVAPETLVGLCVNRSIEMLVGILGILKAGAAYVPIDPDYPPERIAYMAADASLGIMLSERALSDRLAGLECTLVWLDGDADDRGHQGVLSSQPDTDLRTAGIGLSPDSLAYVIYTSGSTGRPKGVLVEHGNVTRLFHSTAADFNFDRHDVWTLFHSFAFDFSVWEIWGALIHGGRLIVVPKWTARAPADCYRLLVDEAVTVLNQTPTVFNAIIAVDRDRREPLSLRTVIFGGEALDVQQLSPWVERHGDQAVALVNMYGITETTVHVTYRRLYRQDIEHAQRSVIGRQLSDLKLYLLDREGLLVPTGVTAEIYVGGSGVARGYLNRPELTAERFVQSPFDPRERLYRTGDLGRYLGDGDLEYRGRIDDQVKVRGFRIELGEIEAVLLKHPRVRDAVVVASDASGEKQLIAYAVMDGGAQGQEPETLSALVRAHAETELPAYMLPAAIVMLEALPLTPNGKVDRKALPALTDAAYAKGRYVAPRTPVEKLLVEVWQDNLGIARIGVEDNYFAVGGDSIRSISMVSAARRRGIEFSIRDLFSHPTIAGLAAISNRTTTRSADAEIAAFALLTDPEKSALAEAADWASLEDAYPMSALQQGMFFHSLKNPHLSVYHDVFTYRIETRWEPGPFAAALRHLVARHQALRTVFWWSSGRPLQMVRRGAEIDLAEIDLRERDAGAQAAAIEGWIETEKKRDFDPSARPWRVAIHVLSDRQIQFGFSFHHAILDGWSTASLVTELFSVYSALAAGLEVEPPVPPPSYKHFIALERAALESEADRAYWSSKLAGARLPWWTGRSKSGGVRLGGVLPASTSRRMIELSRRLEVQEKSAWCAAYLTLISILDGSTDTVGSVVTHGRPELPGGDKMLGLFLSSPPLRIDLEGLSWDELIRAVDAELAEQYAHRHYPLAEIQTDTGLDFSASLFNYTNFHVYGDVGDDTKLVESGGFEETNYLLTLNVQKSEKLERHALLIDAEPSVFDEPFRQRIEAYAGHIIEAMVSDSGQRIDKAGLLGSQELTRQLVEWNATEQSYPRERLIHELFEAQAAAQPEAPAVVADERQLDYRELNQRANRLAHRLRDLGVGPEVRIGICMRRSPELVVAILAVLKAGGCYVPLDPSYPAARLSFLLVDSGVALVLTESGAAEALSGMDVERLHLDRDWGAEEYSPDDPAPLAVPQNLAYVIYTSGSTGRPKGVGIAHAGVVSLLAWSRRELSEADRRGVLASTSVCFDLSIYELFLPLSGGGECILVDGALALETTRNRERVTLVNTVPSAARALLDKGALPPGLRVLNLAGEALKAELVDRLYRDGEVARVYDLYGPSEGTTYSTSTLRAAGGPETIGRPVANTQAYVLDAMGHVQGIGVVGELYVGGVGLARGYLERPALTAERFVPNPFGGTPGDRLYRTGDLVRYLDDGRLEFIGRIDHQVKLRGFRIELGEIETVLSDDPRVGEVIVVTREDRPGNQQLVAYVVAADPGSEADLRAELRAHVQEQLPAYMVPAAIQVLERLPLTPNGKVDRKALPAPDWVDGDAPFAAPRGPVEENLARIWCEVLDLERVGRDDNFFDLGGHSVLVMRLLGLVHTEYDLNIPITTFFEGPTISQMADLIACFDDVANESDELVELEI